MLKIVEEVTTVYRVLDAADRLIRELPTLIEAEAFKLGFEEATPVYETDEQDAEGVSAMWGGKDFEAEVTALDAEIFEDTEPLVTNGSAETIEV